MKKFKRERGFTLIETLFALFAFIMMSSLILQMFLIISPAQSKAKSLNMMEWELFLLNIKREVKMSSSSQVNHNQLRLMLNNQVILIEQYQHLLRRRVDDKGHEVMLQGVKSFRVQQEDSFIIVTVKDESNRAYSEKIPLSYIGEGGVLHH